MDRVGVGVGVGGVKRSVRKRSLCKRRIANMRLDGGRVESAKKAPDVAEWGHVRIDRFGGEVDHRCDTAQFDE